MGVRQKMKKTVFLAIGLSALLLTACGDDADKKVATVDGHKIMQSELNEALMAQYGDEVLETLMTDKIVELEAEKQNIQVTDEEVEEEYQVYIDYYGDEDTFIAAMESYNMDKEDVLADIYDYLVLVKLMKKQIAMTDEEIQAYYDENIENYVDEDGTQLAFEDVKDVVSEDLFESLMNDEYNDWLDEKFEAYDVKTF